MVRESVGRTFGVGTCVVGSGAGLVVCIWLVPFCTAWSGTVPYVIVRVVCTSTLTILYGIMPGSVPHGTCLLAFICSIYVLYGSLLGSTRAYTIWCQ